MFKSQKPSSFDLRVSDFKQIPGFNYVLSVTEDEHTYNSLCSEIRDAWAIDAFFTFLTYLPFNTTAHTF